MRDLFWAADEAISLPKARYTYRYSASEYPRARQLWVSRILEMTWRNILPECKLTQNAAFPKNSLRRQELLGGVRFANVNLGLGEEFTRYLHHLSTMHADVRLEEIKPKEPSYDEVY